MKQESNTLSISLILEAISYFLAGSFVIDHILQRLFPNPQGNIYNQAVNWLTIVIGAILIIASFYTILTTMCRAMNKIASKFVKNKKIIGFISNIVTNYLKMKKWLLIIIYIISVTQILPSFFNESFRLIANAFFILTLIAIFLITVNILKSVLLPLAVILSGGTIIRILQGININEILGAWVTSN